MGGWISAFFEYFHEEVIPNLSICGMKIERPLKNWQFSTMSLLMCISDLFFDYSKRLENFEISEGMTICDYGCGPARCIRKASKMVGKTGMIYGVDVHDKAIKAVERVSKKYKLKNVKAVKSQLYYVKIPNNTFDRVYALDMFHHLKDRTKWLKNVCRILKHDGFLFLDDGHESRIQVLKDLLKAGCFKIVNKDFKDKEKAQFLKLKPVKVL